jgi:hypothetical protein
MTLVQIKAMFQPGQVWIGTRTPGFKGEAQAVSTRKICQVRTQDYICDNGDGERRFYGQFPQARDVIEARDGYLKFNLTTKARAVVAVIELVRQ